MKTITELNQEAGEWVARNWLKGVEAICQKTFVDGEVRHPVRISRLTHSQVVDLIPEFVYEQLMRHNNRWFVSDQRLPKIVAVARAHAADLMRVFPEDYPTAIEYFEKFPTIESTRQ